MFPTRRITLCGDVFRDEYSLSFDGTDDNISISSTAYDVDGGNISFVFWVKRATTGAVHILMGYTGNEYRSRIYFADNDTLRIESDTNGDEATVTQNTNDTGWHHWVLSISSGTVTAYQDGVSASVSGDVNGNNITLDTIAGGGSGGTNLELNGSISEIAIYTTNLSASQVKTLYNSREPYNHKEGIASGDLHAWWRMGDGLENHSGSTIYDMSVNSNNGTMTNMASDDFTGDTP